jgi:coproporphyrinogen III oxidase-like Fe-S oxidoreductase
MTKKALELNGRHQTWEKLEKVFSWIRKNNIKSINVDLMP